MINRVVKLGDLARTMGRLGEPTGGTLRSEVIDVLANDECAVVLQWTRATEREGTA